MKFYLMTLVAVAMMAVSCGGDPKPPTPPTPQVNEVELTNAEVVYFQNYNDGDFEHYMVMFEDKANANISYYAELVSYGNDKKAPTPGKYNLNTEPEAVAGDILLVLEKTIIEGTTDTTALEADSVVMEIKDNEVVINAKYPEGTREKLVYKNALPTAFDFPGNGEPTEVQDFNWTLNRAAIEMQDGMFYLIMLDTVKIQGVQIAGYALASYATAMENNQTLDALPTGTYGSMSFMDFYSYAMSGYAYDAVFSGNYTDVINGSLYSLAFEGLVPTADGGVDFDKTYWLSDLTVVYDKDGENATINVEATSYYGSTFVINYQGPVEETVSNSPASVAPLQLAPKAEQYWGNSLIVKQPRHKKPVVKLAKFIR